MGQKTHLDELENKSIFIIREAYSRLKKIGLLWSIGKDSTTLLWLCRKAFFGRIPFTVLHIDTGYKFPEIYKYRDNYANKWGLDLMVIRNAAAIKKAINPANSKFECCNTLKTQALKDALKKYKLNGLFLGIRRDEHGIRAKERYFSNRDSNFKWDYLNQFPEFWDLYRSNTDGNEHLRIHPLLHWTELDIWKYIHREKIPVVDLYFSKAGTRYRSIGCKPCCTPINSNADNIRRIINELTDTKVSERSGRAQDKENAYTMQKLRSLGYM